MPLFGGRSGVCSAFVAKFHIFLTAFPINLGLKRFVVLTLRIGNRCELVSGLPISLVFVSPPEIANILPAVGFCVWLHLVPPFLLTTVCVGPPVISFLFVFASCVLHRHQDVLCVFSPLNPSR